MPEGDTHHRRDGRGSLKPIVARFDSLRPGVEDRSFVFEELTDEIEAIDIGDVRPAIERVEQAAASGLHVAGFISYEAAPGFDPALTTAPAAQGFPLLWFGIFARRRPIEALAGLPDTGYDLGALTPSIDRDTYEARVLEILDLIAAGDTYQVNFTFRLRGTFAGDDLAFYRDLCLAQRSAYCAYLRARDTTIVSASPELFFRWRGDRIEMRPMKGTRPRGRWAQEDADLARSLQEAPKDRAENLMIVDLLRNDLGRIAQFGSVEVPRIFEVERYPTVHQLTSSIIATVRAGSTLGDVLRATFPSGSVTGAPKVRTSQIIRDLEDSPRGPYTGAIGFVSPDESVFSVAIRTLLLTRGEVEVGIGSGITADSAPRSEYEESLGKGAFLRRVAPDFDLLESLRLEPSGEYPLLEYHLTRMNASAEYFSYAMDVERVREALIAAAGSAPRTLHKARLRVDRAGRERVDLEMISGFTPPARLTMAARPFDDTDPFLYHKTTHRAWIDAAGGIPAGFDDVVFWNRRGEVTETSRANLVLDLDGQLVTPPIESGLLPGVMRERLVADGGVHVRVLMPTDLRRARRVLLVNAVRGWWEGKMSPTAPTPRSTP